MKRFWMLLLTGSALATFSLGSCAQAPTESQADFSQKLEAAPAAGSAEVANEAVPAAQKVATGAEADLVSEPGSRTQTSRPQLVKRAYLSVGVESVEDSYSRVRQIIQQQQGDLLSMQDSGDRQRYLSFELRVPQERLDTTLDALSELGEVRNQSITADDVSSQLVDLQARLKNERKSEEALQKLMERSGDISDVLEVSRELSSVRQDIEQMAAQQQDLQTRIRYSTISLDVESVIALTPDQPATTLQLSNAWRAATHSVGSFTTNLLQIGLWLLAYSPYLVVLLCGAVLVRKVRWVGRS